MKKINIAFITGFSLVLAIFLPIVLSPLFDINYRISIESNEIKQGDILNVRYQVNNGLLFTTIDNGELQIEILDYENSKEHAQLGTIKQGEIKNVIVEIDTSNLYKTTYIINTQLFYTINNETKTKTLTLRLDVI